MSKKIPRIGFLSDALDLSFQNQVLQGVQQECSQNGVDLIIYSGALQYVKRDRTNQYQIVQNYIRKANIDGLVILSGAIAAHYSAERTREIIRGFGDFPIVSIAIEIPGTTPVLLDNRTGVESLMDHLHGVHNYRKIGFIQGPEAHEEADTRLAAHRDYLRKKDLPFKEPWVLRAGAFSEAAGYRSVVQTKQTILEELDALLAVDDSTARGALRALKERGFRVPQDLALCGFDNQLDTAFTEPPLTTVDQPFFEQGKAALRQLLRQLNNEESEESIKLPTRLIIRESCGCMIHDPDKSKRAIQFQELQHISPQRLPRLEEMLKGYPEKWREEHFFEIFQDRLRSDFKMDISLNRWIPMVEHFYSILEGPQWNSKDALSVYHKLNVLLQNYLHMEQKRFVVKNEEYRYKAHLVSHKILSTFRLEELFNLLKNTLPPINIDSFYLVLFEKEEDHRVPRKAKLTVAIQKNKSVNHTENMEIPSTMLIPPELWNREAGTQLVFLPISFQTEHYGYALFSLNQQILVSLYEVLRISIGTALHSCYLMEEIERNSRQKTNLFINIAHEMKTPITLISSYLSRYLEEPQDLNDIHIAQENLAKLKRDMVNFLDNEKLNRGQLIYDKKQNIRISDFIERKILSFQRLAFVRGISMEWLCKEEYFYFCDPSALDRIINNLLENALRHNTTNGRISIALEEQREVLLLRVSNTGHSMTKEQQKQIFDPYFQITQEKSGNQGIGMGLSIIKRIIEDLKGTIEVTSQNNWNVFTVKFPLQEGLSSNEVPCREVITEAPVTSSKARLTPGFYHENWPNLLVVEDNPQLLSYMKEELEKQYNVFFALSAEEALEILDSIAQPDLIVSDIMMDQMDGLDFYQELLNRQEYCCTPFLFVSAKSGREIKLKALELGAVDFIAKPFEIKELIRKIESLIRIHQGQKRMAEKELKDNLKEIFRHEIPLIKLEESQDPLGYWEQLSKQEKKIVERLLYGKQYKEIAFDLSLSINTVKTYIKRIYEKCDINSRLELVDLFPKS